MTKIKKRILTFVLSFLIVFTGLTPIVFAHNAYYLQVMIDKDAKRVVGQVVYDEVGSTWNILGKAVDSIKLKFNKNALESSHDEYKLLKASGRGISVGEPMKMTFPSKLVEKDKAINHGGAMDADRAMRIANDLIPSLNDYLYASHPEGFKTAAEFESALAEAGSLSPNFTDDYGRQYVTLQGQGREGEEKYLYSMIKGYSTQKLEDGSDSPLYTPDMGTSEEMDKITWKDIADYAEMNAKQGVYYASANQNRKGSIGENFLTKVLSSISLGLQSLLGLYPVGDLVFNGGAKATYFYGIMSYDWMSKTSGFFIIFQALALMFVGLALIRLLNKRILATVMPSERVSLQEGIKNLLLTLGLLLMILPFITMLSKLNFELVNILSSFSPNYAFFGLSGGYGVDYNNISGALLSFVYFFLSIYLNVVFILRGVTIAFLTATAPIFVISIAFGKNDYFTTWFKELVANIFIQSFYAFIIVFFLSIQSSSRTIEVIAISFSLIPLTKTFRAIIFGNSGGMLEQIAGNTQGVMTGAAVGIGAGLAVGGSAIAGEVAANGGWGTTIKEGFKGGVSNFQSGVKGFVQGAKDTWNKGTTPQYKFGFKPSQDDINPRGSDKDTIGENVQKLRETQGTVDNPKEGTPTNPGNTDVNKEVNTGGFENPDKTNPALVIDTGKAPENNNEPIKESDTPDLDLENQGEGPEKVIDTGNRIETDKAKENLEENTNSPKEGLRNSAKTFARDIRETAGGVGNKVKAGFGVVSDFGKSAYNKFEAAKESSNPIKRNTAKAISTSAAFGWAGIKGASRVAKRVTPAFVKAYSTSLLAGSFIFNQGVGGKALMPTYLAYKVGKDYIKPNFIKRHEERQEVLRDARKKAITPIFDGKDYTKTKYNDFSRENVGQGFNNYSNKGNFNRSSKGGNNYSNSKNSQNAETIKRNFQEKNRVSEDYRDNEEFSPEEYIRKGGRIPTKEETTINEYSEPFTDEELDRETYEPTEEDMRRSYEEMQEFNRNNNIDNPNGPDDIDFDNNNNNNK